MSWQVLLYVPNIIGYLRLVLLAISWAFYDINKAYFIVFYTFSVVLDMFDGYTARKFNQTSRFGAWFDVVIDNIGRGMLWSRMYSYGYLVAVVEWLTFVCFHSVESHWKDKIINEHPPGFVTKVMENNFRTPTGFVAMGGLHVLPIWLCGLHAGILSTLYIPNFLQLTVAAVLTLGRFLSFTVEVWCIYRHIAYLLQAD